MPITTSLHATEKLYNLCARKAKARLTQPAAPSDIELLVGLGVAADWIGWARELTSVRFSAHRRESDRLESLVELQRFTYLWTAANALFSRPAIFSLLGGAASTVGELKRVRVLHQIANIASATQLAHLKTLHTILDVPMKVHDFPWLPAGTTPKLFEVIYYKYTTSSEQARPFGRSLAAASSAGTISALDLPSIIYATRNWHVHGVLLSSSFRGPRKKFELYIKTINKALAEVLDGVGYRLQALL
jgi:hypothetical protein